MDYPKALSLAEFYLEKVKPVSIRAEIVGSVKRKKAEGIHDIEILLIQKPGHPRPEMGQKKPFLTYLDKLLDDLASEGLIKQAEKKADGDRYKKRTIINAGELNEFNIDFFIVTQETWGLQSLIRTGPSWFSHRAVTPQNVRAIEYDERHIPTGRTGLGFLPKDLTYVRAKESPDKLSHIKRGDEVLSLPEEEDVFNLIFGHWIKPEDRKEYSERKP